MNPSSKKTSKGVVLPCQQKGHLNVEVAATRDDRVEEKKISGVKVKITAGKTKPGPAVTGGNGLVRFADLVAGPYSVSITPGDEDLKTYDFDAIDWDDSQTVAPDTEAMIHFGVPYYLVDYTVTYAEDATPVKNIDYALRVKKRKKGSFESAWSVVEEAKLKADGKIFKLYVPAGKYLLGLKLVWNVTPGAAQVVADGDAFWMQARVAGFAEGTAGEFAIVDAHNHSEVIHTITAKIAPVAKGQNELELKAEWKAKKADFGTWKGGHVVIRASIGKVSCWSAPIPVVRKETVRAALATGTAYDGTISIAFASGATVAAACVKGKAEIEIPMASEICRIDFGALKTARVKVERDGGPAWNWSVA